jgi:CBS domain-containing protein
MPAKLTTTIKNIRSIPSSTNAELVNEFYEFMKSNGSSERHQNNSLKAIIAFAKFLGSDISFLDIQRKEQVTSFLDTKIVRIIGSLQPSLLTSPIREFMSKPVITLSPNNSIKDAIQTMQLKNIRTLPVVENQNLQGIITEKDIFKAIMNNRSLIPDLFSSNQSLMDRRDVFDQFSEYWFSDVLQRR